MTDKMKNLAVRTLSGIVLAAVVLGAVAWSPWSFGALLLLLLVGGMHEFYALAEARGDRPQRLIGMVTGAVLFAVNFAFLSGGAGAAGGPPPLLAAGLGFLLVLLPLVVVRAVFRRGEKPPADVRGTLRGLSHGALPLTLMAYIPFVGRYAWNPWTMLFFVFIIWANDVFAYLVGMAFGRHRLFERLSPKKSWEGFFGGVAGALVMGYVASRCMGEAWWVWIGLALVAAVTGVLGDLVESMFKRAAGVKDSGTIIPGHGGILDRFDAMLLAAPFVVVYLWFVL